MTTHTLASAPAVTWAPFLRRLDELAARIRHAARAAARSYAHQPRHLHNPYRAYTTLAYHLRQTWIHPTPGRPAAHRAGRTITPCPTAN